MHRESPHKQAGLPVCAEGSLHAQLQGRFLPFSDKIIIRGRIIVFLNIQTGNFHPNRRRFVQVVAQDEITGILISAKAVIHGGQVVGPYGELAFAPVDIAEGQRGFP